MSPCRRGKGSPYWSHRGSRTDFLDREDVELVLRVGKGNHRRVLVQTDLTRLDDRNLEKRIVGGNPDLGAVIDPVAEENEVALPRRSGGRQGPRSGQPEPEDQ